MEEEARQIVKSKLMAKPKHGSNLAEALRFRIAPVGGALKPSPSGTVLRWPGRPAVPLYFYHDDYAGRGAAGREASGTLILHC